MGKAEGKVWPVGILLPKEVAHNYLLVHMQLMYKGTSMKELMAKSKQIKYWFVAFVMFCSAVSICINIFIAQFIT